MQNSLTNDAADISDEDEQKEKPKKTKKAAASATNGKKTKRKIVHDDDDEEESPPLKTAAAAAAEASALSPPAEKKRKTASSSSSSSSSSLVIPPKTVATKQTGKYIFYLSFEQPAEFRLLTKILTNLAVDEVTFKIIGAAKTGDFQGIRFNSFASGQVCYISASQSLVVQDITSPDNKAQFSVSLPDLENCMKAIPYTAVTHIYQKVGEDKIRLEATDSATQKVMNMKIPMIDISEQETPQLEDKKFSYTMEIGLMELERGIAATNGDTLSFGLLKRKGELYFRLSSTGRCEFFAYYRTMTGDGGTIQVKTTAPVTLFDDEEKGSSSTSLGELDEKEFEVIFDDAYNVKNLSGFIKGLDKNRAITIYFAPRVCLCMKYGFVNNMSTSEQDFVKYVVACNVTPDD